MSIECLQVFIEMLDQSWFTEQKICLCYQSERNCYFTQQSCHNNQKFQINIDQNTQKQECSQYNYHICRFIRTEPKEYILFNNEPNKLCITSFLIINETSSDVAFKIKTTNPKRYQVKPSVGIISGLKKITIEITTTSPIDESTNTQDKFQVLTSLVQHNEVTGDLIQFWHNRDKSICQTQQLKAKFSNSPANVNDDEPLDPNLFQSIINKPILTNSRTLKSPPPEQPTDLLSYQLENTRLNNELRDLRLSYQESQSNSVTRQAYTQHTDHGAFTLSQMIIVLLLSLMVGYLIGY